MRVNVGWILGAGWLIFFVISLFLSKKYGWRWGFMFSLSNYLICTVYGIFLLGIARLSVVPAAIVREGLRITHTSFTVINCILLFFIGLVLLLMFLRDNNRI